MSKELVFRGEGAALPAHLQEHAKGGDAADLVTSFNSLPSLSIQGKQFRLKKDDGDVVIPMGKPIEVIILAADPAKGCAKTYYAGAWSPDDASVPDCFSADGIKPDSFVDVPVSASCVSCPKNAFGSGTDASGKATKGKACSDHKNLVVVEANNVGGPLFMLRVPATSLKALSQYGRKLAGQDLPFHVLVTELTFAEETVHPQLVFNSVDWVAADVIDKIAERVNGEELQMALPSKNKLDAPKEAETLALPAGKPPEPTKLALPPPPAKEVVREPVKQMTAKAGRGTLEEFLAANWTEEALIEQGYMEIIK
jgi:hypothetical protein